MLAMLHHRIIKKNSLTWKSSSLLFLFIEWSTCCQNAFSANAVFFKLRCGRSFADARWALRNSANGKNVIPLMDQEVR